MIKDQRTGEYVRAGRNRRFAWARNPRSLVNILNMAAARAAHRVSLAKGELYAPNVYTAVFVTPEILQC